MWLGKLTRSVCTQCPPCNPTGSDASWWCHRLEAQHQPRLQLAEPLERHPGGGREGIPILKCCIYTSWGHLSDVNEAFGLLVPSTVLVFPPPDRCWWSFPSCCPGSHFPEPAYGSARTDKGNALSFKLETMKACKSGAECFQFNKPTLRFINQASIRMPRRKIRREFWQASRPEVFAPRSFPRSCCSTCLYL